MKQAQVLTDKDTKRVLAHIARKPIATRNRCMLQLSWLSGMRVGEIAALSVSRTASFREEYAGSETPFQGTCHPPGSGSVRYREKADTRW